VNPNELPTDNNKIFIESGYFHLHGAQLPTPNEVRQLASSRGVDVRNDYRPDPVRFTTQNLLVKWGRSVTIAEGQCLWFLYHHLGDKIPVPEIYGWQTDGDQTFLYMQLVQGDTLAERWDDLSPNEKVQVCGQLRDMVNTWRSIKIGEPHSARSSVTGAACLRPTSQLCQIGGQPLRDIMFDDANAGPAGPFDSITAFHDSFASFASRVSAAQGDLRRNEPELSGLTDDVPDVFTHADLALSNILVSNSPNGSAQIVAVVDWQQAGWYPAPWEWLKANDVAEPDSEWREQYIPQVLTAPHEGYSRSWQYISMALI
jgi:hypothetical protein